MKVKTHKTISIRLKLSEYEKLKNIAQAESRFVSRQAAYWVYQGIRNYPLPGETTLHPEGERPPSFP